MGSLSGKEQHKHRPRVEGAYHFQQMEGGLSGQSCVGSGRGQEDEPGGWREGQVVQALHTSMKCWSLTWEQEEITEWSQVGKLHSLICIFRSSLWLLCAEGMKEDQAEENVLLGGHCISPDDRVCILHWGFYGRDGGVERRAGRFTESKAMEEMFQSGDSENSCIDFASHFPDSLLLLCCNAYFAPTLHPLHPYWDHITLVLSCHNLHCISPEGLGMRYSRCALISSAHPQSRSHPEALCSPSEEMS